MLKSFDYKRILSGLILLSLGFGVFALVYNDPIAKTPTLNQPSLPHWDLTPHDAIIINSNDDFITYGFSGDGTKEEPYLIEGYNITALVTNGIYVRDISKHFEIRNCYVEVDGYGIYLYNVSDFGKVIENYCSSNSIGIAVEESDYILVENNTCIENQDGIWTDESHHGIIKNNNCSDNTNEDGIRVRYASNMTIEGNICNNNILGIVPEISNDIRIFNNTCNNNSWAGIGLADASNVTIMNNTCLLNRDFAIYIENANSFVEVAYNQIEDTFGFGVFIYSNSFNNTIHHNNFINNNFGEIIGETGQAYDEGRNNTWFDRDTNQGNYWNDWISGVYSINGSAGSIDPYPLNIPIVSEYSYNMFLPFLLLVILIPITTKKKHRYCSIGQSMKGNH